MAQLLFLYGFDEQDQDEAQARGYLIASILSQLKQIPSCSIGTETDYYHQLGTNDQLTIGISIYFNAAGENHRLWIESQGTISRVMIASTPTEVEAKLDEWESKLDELSHNGYVAAQRSISRARQILPLLARIAKNAENTEQTQEIEILK